MKLPQLLFLFFTLTGLLAAEEEKPLAPKMEPEAGIYYAHGKGFLNLRIEAGHLRLYFLDKDKAILKPKTSSANIHFKSNRGYPISGARAGDKLLPSEDGKCLAGKRILKPPSQQYRIWGTLDDGTALQSQLYPALLDIDE